MINKKFKRYERVLDSEMNIIFQEKTQIDFTLLVIFLLKSLGIEILYNGTDIAFLVILYFSFKQALVSH